LKPDRILLTETWGNTTIDNASLTIPGFNLEAELRRDREDTEQGVGRGLIVYAQRHLQILSIDKYNKSNYNQFCAFRMPQQILI
jgi:hypothetical protein